MAHITRHAVSRYRERVNADATEHDVRSCLASGNQKKLAKLERGTANTLIIKTGCCYFICSGNRVVSAVKELRQAGCSS